VKYQFNPASLAPGLPDVFIDYTTATDFVASAASRRVWDRLYAGVGALTWSALTRASTSRWARRSDDCRDTPNPQKIIRKISEIG
jgi:hypothetical protein